jgi:diacylglycerol kinase (ATP)
MTNPNNAFEFSAATFPVVFFNPAAGSGRARVCLPRIRRLFESRQIPAIFIETKSSGELESRAREAIAEGHRLLLAMGGDGTVQGLVNAAWGADVIVGVLPAGGGNDFAAALGLPTDPLKAAETLWNAKPRFVDLARASTADGRTRLYVGGGGIGLDAEAARYASQTYRRFPGRLRYIAAGLHALAQHQPLQVRIEFPGADLPAVEASTLLTAVLNTPTYGAGLRLAPGATIDDGLLQVVLIEDLSTWGVLKLLPRLMGSGELRTSRVKRWNARSVRISADRPCLFHGDGEILGPAPVEIEVVPDAVCILTPSNEP